MDQFLTKTLAEIYLQQGHVEKAYTILKTLSERDPENLELKDRLREVEEKMKSLESQSDGHATQEIASVFAPPDDEEEQHPDRHETNSSRLTPSRRSTQEKIQILEKWLKNIKERKKP